MAQQSNEHLTIADLSAYLDEEMAPEELELCRAHIQSCQPCQAALADLRLTSALLSSMPQVAVPRSFALPTNMVLLPETPALAAKTTRVSGGGISRRSAWRRPLRLVSTLVAALGLFLFLAGVLTSFPLSGSANTASSGVVSAPAYSSSSHVQDTRAAVQSATSISATPHYLSPTGKSGHEATALTTPLPSGASTAAGGPNSPGQNPGQSPVLQQGIPSALDLTQPAGRLVVGIVLFLLGVLGVLVTRLLDWQARARH